MLDPVTGISLVKNISDLTTKLYGDVKKLKDREAKQELDELLDDLRDFKQVASELEDENRDLREQLRFKSDEFEFRNPFWYEKPKPEEPLCPRCFSD